MPIVVAWLTLRPDLFRLAAALGQDFAATVLPGASGLNVFRKPLDRPVRLRIRVDVVGAQPPLWRRLTVPSNFRLDVVHGVLQIAFGWTDASVHRFSVGERWDQWAGLAILPSGGAGVDGPGVPEGELRLDQVISKAGDVLRYRYGAAGQWELRIKVEAVEYLRKTDAAAHCLAGRRAGPRKVRAASVCMITSWPSRSTRIVPIGVSSPTSRGRSRNGPSTTGLTWPRSIGRWRRSVLAQLDFVMLEGLCGSIPHHLARGFLPLGDDRRRAHFRRPRPQRRAPPAETGAA